jgi:hypothetical protein
MIENDSRDMLEGEGEERQSEETAFPDEKQWLTWVQDAFTTSTTWFDNNIRPQIEADMRQIQGKHPSGSKYLSDTYKSRAKFFRPKTRAALRKGEAQAAAAFFSNEDVVSVSPVNDANPEQRAAASVRKALLQNRLTGEKMHWYQTCIGAYQEAKGLGCVISKQFWEFIPEKGLDHPVIELIPIENVRFDPAAKWTDPIGTSPYLIIINPLYVKDVKARMKAGKWKEYSDSEISSATRLNNDTTRMQREGGTDSKAQPNAITDFTVAYVFEVVMEHEGVDYLYYTLGSQFLLSEPVPIGKTYFHGRRPYVMGTGFINAHKPIPDSLPKMTSSTQGEINDIANKRMDNINFVLNKRYFAKRNSQVDVRSLARNVVGSVTLMDDLDSVKVVETNDVTSSAYAEQDRLNLDFDDLAGGFSGSSVQSNRSLNETVGGMNILSTSANQVEEYDLKTFAETWAEPVLKQIDLLIQYYETDAKVITIAGQKAAKDLAEAQLSGVTDEMLAQEMTIRVNVGTGSTNPQMKVERLSFGLSAILRAKPDLAAKINDEELVKEVFGALGYKDGKRFFKFEEEEQNPMADLAAQELQKRIDLLVAQIDEVKGKTATHNMEALYSALQTAGVIVTTPATSQVADALLKSAGYVDHDQPPIVPQYGGVPGAPVQVPENTSPMFPPRLQGAGEGMMEGIETQEVDG